MTQLRLTNRALLDLDEIESYSVEHWGKRVADAYMDDLDAALGRLAEDLTLFRERVDYTGRLRFYRVREHVLVGDVIGEVGDVITIWQGTMDFIERLHELEPLLIQETEVLAQQIANSSRSELKTP